MASKTSEQIVRLLFVITALTTATQGFTLYESAAETVRLGDACNTTFVCDVTNAKCSNQTCNCMHGFVKTAAGDACIPRVNIGEQCSENTQCVENSTCKKKCTCNSGYKQKGNECIKMFQVGESCTTEDGCGKHAVCEAGKCQCTEGYIPNVKPDYDCKAALHGYCDDRKDCLFPDVMVCTSNECVCRDTYEENNGTCMGALGDVCMADGCYTKFSECNRKTKKCVCVEGYQQLNSECAAQVGLGDSCDVTATCISHATCALESADPVCKCDREYVPSNDFKSCMKKVGLGVECEESHQCPTGADCLQGTSNKYCTCREDFVPSYDKVTCLRKVTLGESCLEGSQCILQADCSRDPWSPMVCRCIEGLEPSKDNLHCVEKTVRLGDACNTTFVCDVTNAECSNQTCNCMHGFVKTAAGDACIPRVNIGEQCSENTQCVENSTCKKKCTCNSGYKQKGNECIKMFQVGESCTTEDGCGKHAVCEAGKCQCTEGYIPNVKPDYDCKAALHGYCDDRKDCLFPDVMVCTSNECVCRDTYEENNGTCMGALGDVCMAGGCYTKFSECNRKTKKCVCVEGYQQLNSECAAPLTKPCTALGGCANRFAVCSNESICTCDEGYFMRPDATTCLAGYRKLCTIEDGCWDKSAKCWHNSVIENFQCECTSSYIYDKGSNSCKNGSGAMKTSLYILLLSVLAIFRMP